MFSPFDQPFPGFFPASFLWIQLNNATNTAQPHTQLHGFTWTHFLQLVEVGAWNFPRRKNPRSLRPLKYSGDQGRGKIWCFFNSDLKKKSGLEWSLQPKHTKMGLHGILFALIVFGGWPNLTSSWWFYPHGILGQSPTLGRIFTPRKKDMYIHL